MSVGKNSISRISKKETAPAPAEVKTEAVEVKAPETKPAAKTATKKAPAKKAPAKTTAKKPAAPKAPVAKPAAPKAESGFKIYQVSDELPYYLL